MTHEEHPGTITFVDRSRGTTREAPASEVPEERRFVYLRDGVVVDDHARANARVPVVLIEMVALDEAGHPVTTPETAAQVRISEYGPGPELLRTTRMVPLAKK